MAMAPRAWPGCWGLSSSCCSSPADSDGNRPTLVQQEAPGEAGGRDRRQTVAARLLHRHAAWCRTTPVVTAGAANTGHARSIAMGGKIDKIKGRIKEAVGVLADDDNLQREGQLDQVVGEVKEQAERVAEKVKEQVAKAVKKVKNA